MFCVPCKTLGPRSPNKISQPPETTMTEHLYSIPSATTSSVHDLRPTIAVEAIAQGPLQPSDLSGAAAVLIPVGDPLAGIPSFGNRYGKHDPAGRNRGVSGMGCGRKRR